MGADPDHGVRASRNSDLSDVLVFREVDHSRWQDFETLFGARGGPSYCWCMLWRAKGEESRANDGRSRKAAMQRRIAAGVPVGILGYLDGVPVAWCSIAPRTTYRRLGGLEDPADDPERVWSLVCFFIPRPMRGRGFMRQMITAAVETARRHGARAVEAYPVGPDSPSYRFMGYTGVFEARGFQEVGRAGSRRHVMRYRLK